MDEFDFGCRLHRIDFFTNSKKREIWLVMLLALKNKHWMKLKNNTRSNESGVSKNKNKNL